MFARTKATGSASRKANRYLGIRVDTFSFQAPGFYERLGYQRFGKLENYPNGYETIFYFKALSANPNRGTGVADALHRADCK